MAEKGFVMDLKDNNIAVIKMTRTEACSKCRACVAGMSEQDMFIEVENFCDAKKGEWVEIEISENSFLSAVSIMYGLPFIGFLVGLLLGYFVVYKFIPFINRDILSCILAFGTTFAVYFWIRTQEHRWASKKYKPIATKVILYDENK